MWDAQKLTRTAVGPLRFFLTLILSEHVSATIPLNIHRLRYLQVFLSTQLPRRGQCNLVSDGPNFTGYVHTLRFK